MYNLAQLNEQEIDILRKFEAVLCEAFSRGIILVAYERERVLRVDDNGNIYEGSGIGQWGIGQ